MKVDDLKKILQIGLNGLFFLLPWSTLWIIKEQYLNGEKWQYGTVQLYATEILLWMCLLLFVFLYIHALQHKIKQKEIRFTWSKDRIFLSSVLLFLLYSFISISWAINKDIALEQSLCILEAFFLFLLLLVFPLNWRQLCEWFVRGAVLQSILAVYQFISQSTFSSKWLGLVEHPIASPGTSVVAGENIGRVLRAYGSFTHPNILGGYLVISVIFTSCLLFESQKNTKKQKLFLGTALFLQIAALFFTFSRSAWMAVSVYLFGLCFFLVWKKHIQLLKKMILSALVCMVLFSSYIPLVRTRFAHESSQEIRSTTERLEGIKESLEIWKGTPLLGVGAGNYTAAAYMDNPNRPGWEYQPVHVVPLLFSVEFGALGILLFLTIIILFFRLFPNSFSSVFKPPFFLVCIFPLFLLDHYLYTSFVGLLLLSIFSVFCLQFIPTLSPFYTGTNSLCKE